MLTFWSLGCCWCCLSSRDFWSRASRGGRPGRPGRRPRSRCSAARSTGGVWVPAATRAEAAQTRCGNWSLALGFILLLGLFVHLGVGVLFGLLARRPQFVSR